MLGIMVTTAYNNEGEIIMTKQANSAATTDIQIIDLTPENIADYGVCGYKDVKKHLELRRKIEWFKEYHPKGLRIKVLFSKSGGYQGMLEYIPGKYAHRPVNAEGYMFIHCIWVGFKNEFKGKGYATCLIKECIEEAKSKKMLGVAVVTRKGPFMAKRDIFLKNGFESIDEAKPDFELLSLKFDKNAKSPSFKKISAEKYPKGLTILRSAQCPYSVKNVDAIMETAKRMKLQATIVELKDASSVQQAPCAFGTFCIVKDGKVISHHPISNARFENIIKNV
jgi:N-acetylglutamate synthase-like GNAT family acetyltransferase